MTHVTNHLGRTEIGFNWALMQNNQDNQFTCLHWLCCPILFNFKQANSPKQQTELDSKYTTVSVLPQSNKAQKDHWAISGNAVSHRRDEEEGEHGQLDTWHMKVIRRGREDEEAEKNSQNNEATINRQLIFTDDRKTKCFNKLHKNTDWKILRLNFPEIM